MLERASWRHLVAGSIVFIIGRIQKITIKVLKLGGETEPLALWLEARQSSSAALGARLYYLQGSEEEDQLPYLEAKQITSAALGWKHVPLHH